MPSQNKECGVAPKEGKATCSLHGVELEELGTEEVVSLGPASQSYQGTSWRCPISNRIIPDFKSR